MLVICATANINAAREVPVGRGGLSMTFDPDHVTLRGELAADDVVAQTRDYEVLVGERRYTLFDVSAISGAAVSPLMGSMTRQAYRILLTLTNVRLGVWLPHPAVVVAAHDELMNQEAKGNTGHPTDSWWTALGLLLWYVWPLHRRWSKDTEEPGGREARLWAYVLRMRKTHKRMSGFFYHMMQPTLGLLWAEAVGHTSYRSTWICVSDGGHYDNLGLVEALKRGAKNIVVLDASGDNAHTWFTLGGAFALARVDAGIDIKLNPTDMCPKPLSPGEVKQPWAAGTFSPIPEWQGNGAGPDDQPQRTGGNIWVCKLGWSEASPWDVLAYAKEHSDFPTQTTLQQLYDGAQFDAYRELGLSSVIEMLHALRGLAEPVTEPTDIGTSGQLDPANGPVASRVETPPAAR